ncbi:hypothetical protein KKC45_04385 [Patescibacteria group bacterium]|nr:hypothetical protein [Patescibacteria group bacterium]
MKKSSHPELTASGVLGTIAKLVRLVDIDWSYWQCPTNNVTARRNLAEYLKAGCPKVNTDGELVTNQLSEGHELASLILRDDFLSPEDVAKVYGWNYSNEQLENFNETLPEFDELMWLKNNGYMLVAGPSTELNLLQVRDLDNQLFYSKTEVWYVEDKHKFSSDDKVTAGQWLAVRKEAVPNSFGKNWSEQQELIKEIEYVPNASEVSYAITVYYKVRSIYLLRGKYVRTSSVDADGHSVHVGNFDEEGLVVGGYWGGGRGGFLGVSSARK